MLHRGLLLLSHKIFNHIHRGKGCVVCRSSGTTAVHSTIESATALLHKKNGKSDLPEGNSCASSVLSPSLSLGQKQTFSSLNTSHLSVDAVSIPSNEKIENARASVQAGGDCGISQVSCKLFMPSPSLTVEECKRNALCRWLTEDFSTFMPSHSTECCGFYRPSSAVQPRRCNERAEESLSSSLGSGTSSYKSDSDVLSTSSMVEKGSTTAAFPAAPLVEIPNEVCIPPLKVRSNLFLDRLQHLSKKEFEKQARFQQTLIDVQKCFQNCRLPFFLACGTALAAHRENYFIPHDDDIDLGMMFHQLVLLGERIHKGTVSASETEEKYATDGLLALLSSFSMLVPDLLVFDILGSVMKGLEIRLLHTGTNIRTDINVYYNPIPKDDDELVNYHGDFIWAASYYEASWKRKHSMYRYLHAPFESKMEKKLFCGLGTGQNSDGEALFDIPPISYLEEYFGIDWSIPKAFTYSEGLQFGYKNIINE